MSEPCCGQCRHWFRIGPAPAPAGPVLLSAQDAPVAGQCRLQLVTLMRPDGMCQSMYGQVVASFPACSHFAAREAPAGSGNVFGPGVREAWCKKCGKMVPVERFRLMGDWCDACVTRGELP